MLGLRQTKAVISVTHPQYLRPEAVISFFKPNLALVQAQDMEDLFRRLNIKTKYYPNGIDVEKFKPFDKTIKIELRKSYNIDIKKFVLLHVGNILPGRNLDFLRELSKDADIQIVIVASTTIKKHRKVYNKLTKSNIKVIDYYVKNIEEIYNLADAYIFPVMTRPFAIDMPLSVMEAMACNLPVISTRFAGLPAFFSEGDGLIYVNNEKEIIEGIYLIKEEVMSDTLEVRTREKVLPYSWDKLIKQLELIYSELLE